MDLGSGVITGLRHMQPGREEQLIPDRLTPDSHYSIELSLKVLYHKDVITPCLTDLGSGISCKLQAPSLTVTEGYYRIIKKEK